MSDKNKVKDSAESQQELHPNIVALLKEELAQKGSEIENLKVIIIGHEDNAKADAAELARMKDEIGLIVIDKENISKELQGREAIIVDLQTKLLEKDAEVVNLSQQLKVFMQGSVTISEQSTKPLTIPDAPVTINGTQYKFLKPTFTYESRTYTANEASVNSDLLAKIVAIRGQTILRELV